MPNGNRSYRVSTPIARIADAAYTRNYGSGRHKAIKRGGSTAAATAGNTAAATAGSTAAATAGR